MTDFNQDREDFYLEFDLKQERKHPSQKKPVAHQAEAISKLNAWFGSKSEERQGGILTLPTGAGKTYVAVKFLCSPYGPLSKGYKILWLAHTHHLLEQAFYTFASRDHTNGREIASITEPRNYLSIRVVSGTPGHRKVSEVCGQDDVVIGTMQTIQRAHHDCNQRGLADFLKASDGKLFVVFDEAHHSPAPSYRKLITSLQEEYPRMYLLGLTATPTYTDQKKVGWLHTLFPQNIIYQVSSQKLMGDKILAKPVFKKYSTDITPVFDEREYQKWVNTYQDIPEDIIEALANNRTRNQLIAEMYVQHRKEFGKTIIFADRWFQCDMLREMLLKRNVRADVVYSHVDATPGSVEARNRRSKDENKIVLEKFRNQELDVLINVKMLTEGTDVPDVKTVFLTRQTTSKILLTQMVGRALRGPKFGGTEEANIVSFTDQWEQLINWAEYDQLEEGSADDSTVRFGKAPPLNLISIDLVRKLNRQMDTGSNVSLAPFLTWMPIGWYRTNYTSQVDGLDDLEEINNLVMVFEDEVESYQGYIEFVKNQDLSFFEEEAFELERYKEKILYWGEKIFKRDNLEETGLFRNLLDITRHMAQNEKTPPPFFPFEDRDQYNLDELAERLIDQNLSRVDEDKTLRKEYAREDRYWKTIYYRYDQFKSQYDGCVNRLLELRSREEEGEKNDIIDEIYIHPKSQPITLREPFKYEKKEVFKRDGGCLACGSNRELECDHVIPAYYGGINSTENLQTLCKTCNQLKGTQLIDFRLTKTQLTAPPEKFIFLPEPTETHNREDWFEWIIRNLNFFYHCKALKNAGTLWDSKSMSWEIVLNEGNDPDWFNPYLHELTARYSEGRVKGNLEPCKEILLVREADKNQDDEEETDSEEELTDSEIKEVVLTRDKKCLSCEEKSKKMLTVVPRNTINTDKKQSSDEYQTLCKTCIQEYLGRIDFLSRVSPLTQSPIDINLLPLPFRDKNIIDWFSWLIRCINYFYQCSAFEKTFLIGTNRKIFLHVGNNPDWIKPFTDKLLKQYNEGRKKSGFSKNKSISFEIDSHEEAD